MQRRSWQAGTYRQAPRGRQGEAPYPRAGSGGASAEFVVLPARRGRCSPAAGRLPLFVSLPDTGKHLQLGVRAGRWEPQTTGEHGVPTSAPLP